MDTARPPLNHLVLHAGSVADDLGFVALNDLGNVRLARYAKVLDRCLR